MWHKLHPKSVNRVNCDAKMRCVLWFRFQQKEQIVTTSPYSKHEFMWRVWPDVCTSRRERSRKKKSLGRPNPCVATHLDVPDEVVALLGRKLVPEGKGALLAVVLEPLQQFLWRRRAPPSRRRRWRPSRHHHLRHLQSRSSKPTERERERSGDLRLGSDDLRRVVRSDLGAAD